MAVEVTEAEAAEVASAVAPDPPPPGGRILFGLISWGAE